MKCFQWHQHLSDILDQKLPEPLHREWEQHLSHCKKCSDRFNRFKIILNSISSRPKTPLPKHLLQPPFLGFWPRSEVVHFSFRPWNRWEQIPWLFRTIVEATATIGLILGGISLAPKVRTLFEKKLEWSLSDFKEESSLVDSNLESEKDAEEIPPLQEESESRSDDLEGEDESDGKTNTQAGKSELWRFSLKTVSPEELRPMVIRTLKELGIPADTPGLRGTQVPGGIEFDLILSPSFIPMIKNELPKLTQNSDSKAYSSSETHEHFSWYRVKSKRKLPEGKSQVVIWLSQSH